MAEQPPRDVINWFDIPVSDLDRAARFYGAILGGVTLERYRTPSIAGALFPEGGVTGTLLQGEGFVPGHGGSVVYLNGGDDLDTILGRVAGAGGAVLLPKTPIGGDRGYFAYFEDTEGNRIGLHSRG